MRGRSQPAGKRGTTVGRAWQQMSNKDFSGDQSILSQLREPTTYPEVTYLANAFDQIRLYRNASFGPFALARVPQDTSLPDDFLLEDVSNLALVLNDFQHRINPKQQVLSRLKEFYDDVEDYSTKIRGGTVQLFLHEKGLSQPVPAMRLSDGTLHYLSLLAILCHPTPPPLMCIEEPELGLHPDILPTIAELLKEASERTQLIVTTHSDALVSALSDTPESILVCERDSEGTHFQRLEHEPLREWHEKYSLGELWRMGEIWGNSMVVEIRVYVEGGGDGQETKARVRRGFSEFFKNIVIRAREKRIGWHIVPCGSRDRTLDAFNIALRSHPDAFNILMVDAEAPVTVEPRQHLRNRDGWDLGSVTHDQCHLMVQVVEAWLVADIEALQTYYGNGFNSNSIPRTVSPELILAFWTHVTRLGQCATQSGTKPLTNQITRS